MTARRYYHSAAKTKYLARTSLARPGMWRVRAFHSDGVHAPTYSAYRYIVVRQDVPGPLAGIVMP